MEELILQFRDLLIKATNNDKLNWTKETPNVYFCHLDSDTDTVMCTDGLYVIYSKHMTKYYSCDTQPLKFDIEAQLYNNKEKSYLIEAIEILKGM